MSERGGQARSTGLVLLDELAEEHELIDRVAGSLFAWGEACAAGDTPLETRAGFVAFLHAFVVGFHHRREEAILFAALVEHAEAPADRGPIAVLTAEHRRLAAFVDRLEKAAAADEARATAREIARHLWEHLDKERSVLFAETPRRLAGGGVRELAGRGPSVEEARARAAGEALVAEVEPVDDPELVRGDGCICCSAFGDSCHGLEAEWWTSWEWLHHRSLEDG